MKLRLGVLGAGSWAVVSHLPQLAARADEVEFVGVCRKGRDELEWIRQRFGFAMASEHHHDVLDAGPDIVVVASPASLHYEHARDALLAGAHVLVEKPFTLTSWQAWDLVAIAGREKRHLLVAFGYNYRPLVQSAARALAAEGGVGALESLSVSMATVCRELLAGTGAYPMADLRTRPDPQTWSDPARSGGGYAQAQFSHALGLAMLLFATSGESVYAQSSNPVGGVVEQHCAAVVRWRGGAIGTLTGNATHQGAMANRDLIRVHAVGSLGQFCLDLDRDGYTYFRPDRGELGFAGRPGAGAYDCVGPPNALIDLAAGRSEVNHSPGELGARTVEMIEAFYASTGSGEVMRVRPRPSLEGEPSA